MKHPLVSIAYPARLGEPASVQGPDWTAEVYAMSKVRIVEMSELIAQAPAMLAALKNLTGRCATWETDSEACHDEQYDRLCSPEDPQDCLIYQARASIRAAEGG